MGKKTVHYHYGRNNRVGAGRFLFHAVMTLLTGGIWLVGLFIYAALKR